MRFNELIIIYLAAAAPVGVAYFFRLTATHVRRSRDLAHAAVAALLWPLILLLQLRTLQPAKESASNMADPRRESSRLEQAEHASRMLLDALHLTEDLTLELYPTRGEKVRGLIRETRACVECYVGLSLAVVEAREDDPPTERELELLCIAGRQQDDLIVAGRCIHRRNVARLKVHHTHARHEFVHTLSTLSAVHETADNALTATAKNRVAGTKLAEATLRVLALAFELASLLEDKCASASVAHLLEATDVRVRQLESSAHTEAPDDENRGEQCMTPITQSHARHTPPTLQTLARG